MPRIDPYNKTDQLDDEVTEVLVTRLESRGKHPRFQQMLDDYLTAMNIEEADRVLDLGCGTGVAARAIAQRPGFDGLVIGIDLSPGLVAAARRLAEEEGVGGRTRFETADTRYLDLPDGSFGAVVAHTLLSHVDEPAGVLEQARQAVRPGGLIGVFDGDYASLAFEAGNEATAKENNEKLIQAMVTKPRVMRRLPILAKNAGLEIVESFGYLLTEIGEADFWLTGIQSFGKLMPKSGVMSEEEAKAWTDSLLKASDDGVFFGSSNFYGYVLKRV